METFAVKEGIGNAALNLHPETAREKIKQKVKLAMQNRQKYEPYRLKGPYTLVVRYKHETMVNDKAFQPGVERTGDWELTYRSNDIMDIIKTYYLMR